MPKRYVRSWLTASDLAKKARDKDHGYCLDGSTRVRLSHDKHGFRPDGKVAPDNAIYALVHFHTEVIYYYPNGDIGINLHGWDSHTTKQRIADHTSARISTNKGKVGLYFRNLRVPIDASEEYIIRDRSLIDPTGVEISMTCKTALPRRPSKSRKPLAKPCIGDLLRSPDGTHWLVARDDRSGALRLNEYLGDLPGYRAFSVVTGQVIDLNPLFLLTTDGWSPVERFDLKVVSNAA